MVNFDVLPMPILEAIGQESKSRREPLGRYHVTEVLYCLVKSQLTRHALECRRFDDKSVRNLSWTLFRGQLFHKAFQTVMGNGIPVGHTWQDPDGDKISLVGEADWIETNDEGRHIGELKTVKNRWWYEKNGVGPEHRLQVGAYLSMLPERINKAAFYYLDMEGITRIPVVYRPDELADIMAFFKGRTELLHNFLKTKTLGDKRLEWKKSWECNPKYCPFTEFCHPDYPFEPPEERPDLKEWYAGPMKVDAHAIKENVLPTDTIFAILDEVGVRCDWRKRE